MAFNSKEFQANFLNQVTDRIGEMTDEAKAFKERQIEASDRNKTLISTRTARANAAVSLGREALQYIPEGARSKAIIRTAMASGMTGVSELRNKLAKAHADAGLAAGQTLSMNDVEAVINMPNIPDIDTKFIDMPLEQFAKETYGATAKATKFKDDTNIVGRLFGFGAMDKAREELGEMDAMDGMSVADINAAARLSEFNSLIPNAVMSFSQMETFTKKNGFTFVKELTEEYEDAYNSSEADDAVDLAYNSYIAAQEDLGRKPGSITPAEIANQKAIARKAYAQRKAKAFIDATAVRYGGAGQGFFEQKFAMDQIAEIMGKDFVEDLMKSYKFTTESDDKDKDKEVEPKLETLEFDESDVQDEVEPIGDEDLRIAPSLPVEKHRPSGKENIGMVGKPADRKWDRQYKGRYTYDGKPILVEPRPTDPKAKVYIYKGLKVQKRKSQVNAMDNWDDQYGDTHNHDGTPKQLKGD
ncbi:hypothetical protein OAF92_01260 [bacterium]|nr:hypothetical protein [bacterium]